MKLNKLTEYTPLEIALLKGIKANYFATNRGKLLARKTPREFPNLDYGVGGGNYGAQLKPRHKQYFGGLHGR